MVRRFGQIIKAKPDGLADYKKWHANPMQGVNEMIKDKKDASASKNPAIPHINLLWQAGQLYFYKSM